MKQVALSYFTDLDWSLLALMLFFISFVFLIIKVFFYEQKDFYDHLADFPLQKEEDSNVRS